MLHKTKRMYTSTIHDLTTLLRRGTNNLLHRLWWQDALQRHAHSRSLVGDHGHPLRDLAWLLVERGRGPCLGALDQGLEIDVRSVVLHNAFDAPPVSRVHLGREVLEPLHRLARVSRYAQHLSIRQGTRVSPAKYFPQGGVSRMVAIVTYREVAGLDVVDDTGCWHVGRWRAYTTNRKC